MLEKMENNKLIISSEYFRLSPSFDEKSFDNDDER